MPLLWRPTYDVISSKIQNKEGIDINIISQTCVKEGPNWYTTYLGRYQCEISSQ